MTNVINVTSLSKSYGGSHALKDVSFTIGEGTIYGLIGPNGAGKTTTLAILAGLVAPTSGEAKVRQGARIGFYSPQFALFDYLTGREILLTCGLLQGVARRDVESRTDELLTLLDLQLAADHYLYEYSLGMRQKLGLAAAFIHDPEVLLLDEPFDGLDAASVYRVVATLRTMARNGRTLVLTSHDLALVERVCDRVGVLHNGVIVREFEMGDRPSTESPTGPGDLESLLWQVVGTPDYKQLSWI
jgi:ABC-2 type transport system ATP-binding protein